MGKNREHAVHTGISVGSHGLGRAGVLLGASLAAQVATTQLGFAFNKLAPEFSRLDPSSRIKNLPSQNVQAALQAIGAELGALPPVIEDFVEPLLAPTFAPTMITASQKRNIIPAVCEITVNVPVTVALGPAVVVPVAVIVLVPIWVGTATGSFTGRWMKSEAIHAMLDAAATMKPAVRERQAAGKIGMK